MAATTFRELRHKLDDLGYYQSLVPESVPLVEALLHDLLATTHNLKICKEQASNRSPSIKDPLVTSTPIVIESRSQKPQDPSKVAKLEARVADLELLNQECLSVIKGLQRDVEERSKKILKLELAGNRAKVVTHGERPVLIETGEPRIEMSALIRGKSKRTQSASQSPSSSSTQTSTKSSELDLIYMYEKRNHDLDEELRRLQSELHRAKEILAQVDKHWNKPTHFEKAESDVASEGSQSSYMMKLIKDNDRLKEQLAALEAHTKECFHGKRVLDHGCCSFQPTPGCPQNVREAVKKSHIELHNQCLKNQLKVKLSEKPGKVDPLMRHHQLDLQHTQIHKLEDELRRLSAENRDFQRRLLDLSKINETLKFKLNQAAEQQKILLSGCNGGKVGELVHYMEQQRDVYKRNMEELLDKLDPDRRKVADQEKMVDKENENLVLYTRKPKVLLKSNLPPAPVQVFKNIQNVGRQPVQHVFRQDPHYSPSAYQSTIEDVTKTSEGQSDSISSCDKCKTFYEVTDQLQQLKRDKDELEQQLSHQNSNLQKDINQLREEFSRLELEKLDVQRKLKDQVSILRDDNDMALNQFQKDLRAFQREVEILRSEIEEKTVNLQKVTMAKDSIQAELSNRLMEVENLKETVKELSSKSENARFSKTSQEKQLNQVLLEVQHLKAKISELQIQNSAAKERIEVEKTLNRKLVSENTKLRDEVKATKEEVTKNYKQSEDLRGHVQRYVNEVKRIEEILALREKERMELLDQYKHLAGEVDSAESYGRKLEFQVSQLRLELSTRSAELQASELRLSNMEKDLVEISLSNENYRSQVAALSSKVDIAESELRSIRAQSTWGSADLTDVNQLAEELNAQKAELHNKLNEQAKEIELQNVEIRNLREEIVHLTKIIAHERIKTADLERRLQHSPTGGRTSDEDKER